MLHFLLILQIRPTKKMHDFIPSSLTLDIGLALVWVLEVEASSIPDLENRVTRTSLGFRGYTVLWVRVQTRAPYFGLFSVLFMVKESFSFTFVIFSTLSPNAEIMASVREFWAFVTFRKPTTREIYRRIFWFYVLFFHHHGSQGSRWQFGFNLFVVLLFFSINAKCSMWY